MSLINITNLTFAYEGSYDNIFENVSFQIDTDWKLGFVGRNGRGKTTFLNLLMGKHEYGGTISATVEFDYFPFHVPDEEMTAADVAYFIEPGFHRWQLEREIALLNMEGDVILRPFRTLSNGERTKALLAALFLRENNFLLIDEPTNHLDMEGREIVAGYLQKKKGFILVSHDRSFIDSCVDHILSINRVGIEVQKGNFSSWWENKERRDTFELNENSRLQKEIKKLSAAAKRTAGWSDKIEKTKYKAPGVDFVDRGYIGHQAAKMMARSKAIEKRQNARIEEKSALLKNIESAEELKLSPLSYRTEKLCEAYELSISYDGTPVFENVSFTVNRGDRISLIGKNGSGKSSILKLLTGGQIQYTGRLDVGSGLVISYVPQDTAFLRGNLRDFAEEHGIDESLFKAILRKLDFSREQFDKDISDFSAGQKKKVLIARSLCEKAHLYIWDEPMNFIDVLSRMQIEELLLKYSPTMIFVEHDREFCRNTATKTVAL